MITRPIFLNWMTDEDWDKIDFHWGCVCDYDMTWDDEADYEAWCRRILAK